MSTVAPSLHYPREMIYAALAARFAAISNIIETVPTNIGQPIQTFSRRVKSWDECNANGAPYLFQTQVKELARKMTWAPTVWHFYVDLALYVFTGPGWNNIASTALNNAMDAIELSLTDQFNYPEQQLSQASPVQYTQLVTEARIEGEVEIFEGVGINNNWLVAMIPIEIVPISS